MSFVRLLGPIFAASLAFGATASQAANVSADHCWIRQMPATTPSGGFFIVNNGSDQDLVLTGANSPDYGMIMLHETKDVDGVSKMSMVHDVTVPANGTLEFKPGSYHIMLEQPRDGIAVGDHIALQLEFKDGSKTDLECEVKSPKDLSGMGHQHHGDHGGHNH